MLRRILLQARLNLPRSSNFSPSSTNVSLKCPIPQDSPVINLDPIVELNAPHGTSENQPRISYYSTGKRIVKPARYR